MKKQLLHISIGVLLLLGLQGMLYAQSGEAKLFSFNFKGEPLTEVLQQVARETGVDMVYDPEIVKGFHVYTRVEEKTAPELLKSILEDSPLDYLTLSSGTIVIVQPVHKSPAYGSYYGKVVDRQTGEPLPGASVMLADASGGTSAGPAGTFALNKLISGSYKIIFSYVGYQSVSKTIDISPAAEKHQQITLQPKPVDFRPIVVRAHQPQIPIGHSQRSKISSTTHWQPTGKMHESIRSLSLFSGVQHGLTMSDLHVQGGRQGEHRILLDGVPVYNPYSFGQMFSAFSPYAINTVELHKAGYSVSEGSQTAGLINLKQDIGSVHRNQAVFQADPLSVNLRGDLYFPDLSSNEQSSLKIMTAARSNYWNIYQEPTLNRTLKEWDDLDPLIAGSLIETNANPSLYQPREHQADVRFYDVHFASQYDINQHNTLSSSFYIGQNFVQTDLLREAPEQQDLPRYLYASDEYKWNNIMGRLSFNRQISPRLELDTQLSYSANRLSHKYLIGTSDSPVILNPDGTSHDVYAQFQAGSAQTQLPVQASDNAINHFIAKSDARYYLSPTFNIEGGLQLDVISSSVNFSDLFYLPTLSQQKSTFLSNYLDGNWQLGHYWKFSLGNRLTYINSGKRFYTEPRANIQYDHSNEDANQGSWSARVAGGLYRQFINQFEITNPGPTSLVPSFSVWSHAGQTEKPKAWHLSGSLHMQAAENTTVKVEGFYKWQPTTYTVSYENLLDGTIINRSSFEAFGQKTDMRLLGGGARINQSLAQSKIKLMAGYDYSFNSINLDSQFGRRVSAPWTEPHRFQFRTLWRPFNQLTAVAKWQSILGRSWGFRQAYYNFLAFREQNEVGQFSFATPEDDRLSPYHQLDISIIYKPKISDVKTKIRLNLINLLNRPNTIDWSLRPSKNNDTYIIKKRTMPGFNPSLSIQVEI